MSIDMIGNFLTIIRNATVRTKPAVVVPFTQITFAVATILKNEGFVRDVVRLPRQEGMSFDMMKVSLKYVEGESVIHEIKRVSTPGRRVYEGVVKMRRVIDGLGIAVVTTNKGIMTDKEARQLRVGGEVLCTVW